MVDCIKVFFISGIWVLVIMLNWHCKDIDKQLQTISKQLPAATQPADKRK
jgi:hypothetical protein